MAQRHDRLMLSPDLIDDSRTTVAEPGAASKKFSEPLLWELDNRMKACEEEKRKLDQNITALGEIRNLLANMGDVMNANIQDALLRLEHHEPPSKGLLEVTLKYMRRLRVAIENSSCSETNVKDLEMYIQDYLSLHTRGVQALATSSASTGDNQEEVNRFLMVSCRQGNVDMLKRAAKMGADVRASETQGQRLTPLHVAARRGDERMVFVLLALGGDVRARSLPDEERGRTLTPIDVAANHGHFKIAKIMETWDDLC